MHPGEFYALPQSPQLFKQILMIAGMDRYFQIARCFRDEDLRADRQPEFTQVDVEMSFARPEIVFGVIEPLMQAHLRGDRREIETPFPRMPYAEAIASYGIDKPDLRCGMPIQDLRERFASQPSGVRAIVRGGGTVRGFVVPAGGYSRSEVDGSSIRPSSWARPASSGRAGRGRHPHELDREGARREAACADARCVGGRAGDLLLLAAGEPEADVEAAGAARPASRRRRT